MATKQFTKMMMLVAVLSAALTAVATAQTPSSFRGVDMPLNDNNYDSYSLPMFVDFSDSFARDGAVNDTVVDGFRSGYVPPFEVDPAGNSVPTGPLSGLAANLAGRWMPQSGSDYITSSLNGGSVSRVTGDGPAVACLPWRVSPELGKGYLVEASAIITQGETVTIGYFGDVSQYGTDQGLANELGQLVLGISRGTQAAGNQNELSWTVAWDDEGNRRTVSGSTVNSAVGEQVTMQLRWDDIRNSGNDLFDAWLGTDGGNQRLAAGDMSTEIDVFGAGFEMNGTGSMITGFVTAVPEPSSMLMGLVGLLLVGMKTRK